MKGASFPELLLEADLLPGVGCLVGVGAGVWSRGEERQTPSPPPPPPPEVATATAAVGPHPTGMHSCLIISCRSSIVSEKALQEIQKDDSVNSGFQKQVST